MIDSKPRRRRFQISLRTMAVLMGLAGAGLGLWQAQVASIRRDWNLIEPVLRSGASVEIEIERNAQVGGVNRL